MNDVVYSAKEKVRSVWRSLGPGLVTGAADDDPAGITVYTQAGAGYGYVYAWFAFVTFPLMVVVQEMCARIGVVTGRGLAAHIRSEYSRPVLCIIAALLFIANTFNIAANIAAMTEAMRLLVPVLPYTLLVIAFGLGTAYAQVRVPYAQYAQYLKYLTLSLFAYVFVALLSHVPWSEVGRSIVSLHIPTSGDGLFLLAALLGTTISPYLFFWQTAQEIEEVDARAAGTPVLVRTEVTDSAITNMRLDVGVGMFFSNLITFFIIVASGATLFASGITTIETVGDAMQALAMFGSLAPVLFALGIVGTGLLAVPVLAASSAYVLAECAGWREGLGRSFNEARGFYVVICLGIGLGCSASLVGVDAVTMLLYSGFLNALLAPIILFFIIRLTSNKKLMRGYHNSRTGASIGWFTLMAMTAVCVAVFVA